MAIPSNKHELIFAIETQFEKLNKDLKSITESESRKLELIGHAQNTMMSVHNLSSYLVGWGQLVLKWIKQDQLNQEIIFPEEAYKWTELGKLAQKFYKDYQQLSYEELQKLLHETIKEILSYIKSTNNSKLYSDAFYKHYPLGRMIQLNTSSPYKNARARVRKWKKEKK